MSSGVAGQDQMPITWALEIQRRAVVPEFAHVEHGPTGDAGA